MRVLQRPERVDGEHEVVDLTAHEAGSSPTSIVAPAESRTVDRGDGWGTVLAFAIAGTLAIVVILGVWAAAPSPGF